MNKMDIVMRRSYTEITKKYFPNIKLMSSEVAKEMGASGSFVVKIKITTF
jgi:hypothetical protein